jgi:hypothetical protein
MRSRSTGALGPTGDPRGASSYQRRYKGQADRVLSYVNAGIPIGAPERIELTRGVATPGGSLQCVVYANTDLALWVGDSKRTPQGNFDAFQEPEYTHYDFDYYLPTIDVSLDRASYRAGETQTITLETSSLGSDRDLEVLFLIEGPGGQSFQHANAGSRFPLAFRRGASGAVTYILDLPLGIAGGPCTLTATLFERGTSDVVDVSLVTFDVQ